MRAPPLDRGRGGNNFVQGSFRRGQFRKQKISPPLQIQSLHCLTHALHCQSPQISERGNFGTFFKDKIFPRNPQPLCTLHSVHTSRPRIPSRTLSCIHLEHSPVSALLMETVKVRELVSGAEERVQLRDTGGAPRPYTGTSKTACCPAT